MKFYAQNGGQRPSRLSEATRAFAHDSLNRKYGLDTLKTNAVSLDDIENFSELSKIERYDIAIRRIAEEAPIRLCEGERLSGAATLGMAQRFQKDETSANGWKWAEHNPETQKAGAELLFYQNKCILCGACVSVCRAAAQRTDQERQIDRQRCISCFDCTSQCPTGALVRCGEEMTVGEIVKTVQKDAAFYGKNGGITLSGGEPFAQGEATLALLRECKARGLSTVAETCGYADGALLRQAVEFTDLFLWDIKDTDDVRHRQYTGVSNRLILGNLRAVNEMNAKIRLRCILVNGVNTDPAHYEKLAELAREIRNFDGVEFIPYHAYGGTKSVFLGLEDSGRAEWIPTEEQIAEAMNVLRAKGVKGIP